MNTTNRKNILILAFTLVVVMLGYGMVIPIMPFYIEELGAGGTELGLLVASYALMRLIFRAYLGQLIRPLRTQAGPDDRRVRICRRYAAVRPVYGIVDAVRSPHPIGHPVFRHWTDHDGLRQRQHL